MTTTRSVVALAENDKNVSDGVTFRRGGISESRRLFQTA